MGFVRGMEKLRGGEVFERRKEDFHPGELLVVL